MKDSMKKLISTFLLLSMSNVVMAYECDGRQYCSQMTSCDEASWFLVNCPDMKMDGDNDGIPCEKQWCNSSNATYINKQPISRKQPVDLIAHLEQGQ